MREGSSNCVTLKSQFNI